MKRILAMGLVLVLFSGLLGGCGKDWSHIQAEDFVLTITSDKTTYGQHEDTIINISLENKSGEDLEIYYYFLFYPQIPSATNYPVDTVMPQYPNSKVISNNGSIKRIENMAGYFEPGQHEIKYKARFFLDREENELVVWSNTITITITE